MYLCVRVRVCVLVNVYVAHALCRRPQTHGGPKDEAVEIFQDNNSQDSRSQGYVITHNLGHTGKHRCQTQIAHEGNIYNQQSGGEKRRKHY